MTTPVQVEQNVRFIHVRNPEKSLYPFREFTVAYFYDQTAGQFFAGFAYCSRKDNYVRKAGAALAKARLIAGMFPETETELDKAFYLPISDVTLFNTPAALRQFAVNWGFHNA